MGLQFAHLYVVSGFSRTTTVRLKWTLRPNGIRFSPVYFCSAEHGDGHAHTRSAADHMGHNDRFADRRSHPFYHRLNQRLRAHGFDSSKRNAPGGASGNGTRVPTNTACRP